MTDRPQQNSWRMLYEELCVRVLTPVSQVTFGVFLVLGIIICGGAPIWVELVRFLAGASPDTENIRTAINCYFPAIGCAAAVQLAFADENRRKFLTAFSYLGTFFFFICSLLTLLLERKPVTCRAWLIGIGLSALAILMWWIANGMDRTFQDFDPRAAVGGEPGKSVPGNTTGFAI